MTFKVKLFMTQQTSKKNKRPLQKFLLFVSFFYLFLGFSAPLIAGEAPYVRHSIRALGMGNAFVAVSDDEYVLFYNPAGLEQIQSTIYQVFNPSLTRNQTADDLMEIPIADRPTALLGMVGETFLVEEDTDVMSILSHGWGYSLFTNGRLQADILSSSIKLLAYQQVGLLSGMSWSFMDHSLDVGVAAQYVIRQGIQQSISVTDFADADLLNTIQNNAVSTGKSSFNTGVLYHLDESFLYPTTLGFTVRNIGGMHFKHASGISSTVDVGIATEIDFFGADLLFAADYVDIFGAQAKLDLQRSAHFGMEIGLFRTGPKKHVMTWRFGMNGAYASSGFSIRLPYLFQFDYAAWTESIGDTATDVPDRRQALQLSFNY